jgi:16S rRNA (guanine(966)-N(2))-methyltransferase RsmD
MRIISGKYKGRRISASSKITARPTTDFAKEGLFNLLNNRIDFEDIDVLDLFAGTGGIGVEFSSRGAKTITSIESNKTHCSFIKKVCTELGIENLNIVHMDVFKYILQGQIQFDMIFADPPYEIKNLEEIPDLIFSQQLLKQDGLFVLEHSTKHSFTNHPFFNSHRHYGNVNFSFFSHLSNPDK